ncbi:MAG: hypothetical protein WBD47_19080 [Phormidesmis sp.]
MDHSQKRSLPQTPNQADSIPYSLGTVQTISNSSFSTTTEPQSVYELADGRRIISRSCGQ